MVAASYLTPAKIEELRDLRLGMIASLIALRGRTITFRYHDDNAASDFSRAPQAVLVTPDGMRATNVEGESIALAWQTGEIAKPAPLVVAPGDWFTLDGYPAHVTDVLPPDRGVERARYALGAAVGGPG